MVEFVGIKCNFSNKSISLKREALLFDKIVLVQNIDSETNPDFVKELDLLTKDKLIINMNWAIHDITSEERSYFKEGKEVKDSSEAYRQRLFFENKIEPIRYFLQTPWQKHFNPRFFTLTSIKSLDSSIARISSGIFTSETCEATALINKHNIVGIPNYSVASSDVLQVVLNEFPIINETNPLVNIIAFKKDNRDKLIALRRWIYEVTRKGLSPKEANIELQYLMSEYKKEMDLYELKYSQGKIETIVTLTLDVLENLAKFKLSNVAKSFFNLKKQKIDLLEAEMKAPGREISYIIQAQNTFVQKKPSGRH